MTAIALVGSSGFIGRAVHDALAEAGHDVRIPARVPTTPAIRQPLDSLSVIGSQPAFEELVESLRGAAVVVNAAGAATPGSTNHQMLAEANAILPAVLAAAAHLAGVSRLVHISSAAVQGRRNPLDDSSILAPLTAYGRSKALGEAWLAECAHLAEVVVYRPTSVVSPSQANFLALRRVGRSPIQVSISGPPRPLPLTLLSSASQAVLLLATADKAPRIAVHPFEGATTDLLREIPRYPQLNVHLPDSAVEIALGFAQTLTRHHSGASALLRRLELLVFGQEIHSGALEKLGYQPRADMEEFRQLLKGQL